MLYLQSRETSFFFKFLQPIAVFFCKVKINGGGIVNPIQDGPFWSCSWMGGSQKAPLPKICNIYTTLGSYTLPREDLKIYKSHDKL